MANVTVTVAHDALIHERIERAVGSTFQTSEEHARELEQRGLIAPLNTEHPSRPAGDELIAPNLKVADYQAGNAKNIAKLVSAADLETATAVLAYEQAHENRETVTKAASARVAELTPA